MRASLRSPISHRTAHSSVIASIPARPAAAPAPPGLTRLYPPCAACFALKCSAARTESVAKSPATPSPITMLFTRTPLPATSESTMSPHPFVETYANLFAAHHPAVRAELPRELDPH